MGVAFSLSFENEVMNYRGRNLITCEEAKEVEIGFEGMEPVIADEAWNCITTPIIPRIFVTACKG